MRRGAARRGALGSIGRGGFGVGDWLALVRPFRNAVRLICSGVGGLVKSACASLRPPSKTERNKFNWQYEMGSSILHVLKSGTSYKSLKSMN